jgi:hypothetical protein
MNLAKKIITNIFIFVCLLCVAGTTFAVGIDNPLTGVSDFPTLFNNLVKTFMDLLTALGTLMVMVAGILYLTSAGNPGRMQTAKTALGLACIGLLIGLSGSAIVDTIKNTTTGATDIPTIIANIATQVGILVGALSTLMFLISGFFYLGSGGIPQKMEMAKNVLTYAIIGIVIGLSAGAIVATITSWAS